MAVEVMVLSTQHAADIDTEMLRIEISRHSIDSVMTRLKRLLRYRWGSSRWQQAAIDDGPRREDGDAPHRGPAPPARQRVHLEDLSKEALCAHMRHSPTLGRLQGDAKPWNERQQLRELVRPRHQYNDREAGRCNILLVLEVAVSCDERDNTLGKNESQKSPVASTGPSALGNRLDVESEQFPLQWTGHTLVQQNTRR